MSHQAAAGRGAGRGGGRKLKFIPRGGGVESLSKAFRSSTLGIEKWTFNTGQNKFAAQFTLSHEEVVNYIQRTLANKGYLVAEMIRSKRNSQSRYRRRWIRRIPTSWTWRQFGRKMLRPSPRGNRN